MSESVGQRGYHNQFAPRVLVSLSHDPLVPSLHGYLAAQWAENEQKFLLVTEWRVKIEYVYAIKLH